MVDKPKKQKWVLLTEWAISKGELAQNHSDNDVKRLYRWFRRNFNVPTRRLRQISEHVRNRRYRFK
jgi:hypothetical protein